MLSVADIPMAGIHFTGIIGVVLWHGKEYRLATYLGAKVSQNQNGKIRIVQGNMELEVCLLEKVKCQLKARYFVLKQPKRLLNMNTCVMSEKYNL